MKREGGGGMVFSIFPKGNALNFIGIVVAVKTIEQVYKSLFSFASNHKINAATVFIKQFFITEGCMDISNNGDHVWVYFFTQFARRVRAVTDRTVKGVAEIFRAVMGIGHRVVLVDDHSTVAALADRWRQPARCPRSLAALAERFSDRAVAHRRGGVR